MHSKKDIFPIGLRQKTKKVNISILFRLFFNSILLIFGLFFISIAFFSACDDGPTEVEDNDTTYIYRTDTLFLTDTFHVSDTFTCIETLAVFDTFFISDTIFNSDTFFVHDTVLIEGNTVYHVPWSAYINPLLEGDNFLQALFITPLTLDSLEIILDAGGTDAQIQSQEYGFRIISNGKDGFGENLSSGEYIVSVDIFLEHGHITVEETLRVVNFGITGLTFTNSQSYLYHKKKLNELQYIEIAAENKQWKRHSIIDESPEPWWQSQYPPFHYHDTLAYNLPIVLHRNLTPLVDIEISGESADVLVSVNGGEYLSSASALSNFADVIGSSVKTIQFRFAISHGEELLHLPGEFQSQHIFYTIFHEPVLLDAVEFGGFHAVARKTGGIGEATSPDFFATGDNKGFRVDHKTIHKTKQYGNE